MTATNTAPARPGDGTNAPHRTAMLAAGWRMERDLFGGVTWVCPHSGIEWDDWNAMMFWQTGDRPSVPRVKKPLEAS